MHVVQQSGKDGGGSSEPPPFAMEKYTPPAIPIGGWMSAEELQWLYSQARRFKSIVEVGSWLGRSTHALCSGCAGKVYAVDHFRGTPSERSDQHRLALYVDIYKRFKENMVGFQNLEAFQLPSHQAAPKFAPRSIEMVFIDGGHSLEEVRVDLRLWLPVATHLICGHDWDLQSVRTAVEQEIGLPQIPAAGSIWAISLGGAK